MTYLPNKPNAWQINVDGREGPFPILLEADGVTVSGTLFGDSISGLWNEASAKLSFTRVDSSSGTLEIYTGYLSPRISRPLPGKYYLAGTFEKGTGTFGWFAEITIVD